MRSFEPSLSEHSGFMIDVLRMHTELSNVSMIALLSLYQINFLNLPTVAYADSPGVLATEVAPVMFVTTLFVSAPTAPA